MTSPEQSLDHSAGESFSIVAAEFNDELQNDYAITRKTQT
jgi:hypothetical protein